MRFLADENLPKSIVEWQREEGHDCLWARTDLRGWKDLALLDKAEAEARIVLTLDKDFLQIAIQRTVPLSQANVILLRVHPATEVYLMPLVRMALAADDPWAGSVSVVSSSGIDRLAPGSR